MQKSQNCLLSLPFGKDAKSYLDPLSVLSLRSAEVQARGYTCWDPASPLFVTEVAGVRTLCIPSVFVSFTGEALDDRLGLLRSNEAVSREATALLAMLGDDGVRRVETTLGTEQEYFLIDRAYYSLRPDLQMCGRTLLGAKPPRGQQLEDHYFAAVPSRVQAFMAEAEGELYKLGVPVKTRHNEVAPAQFETAPIFEASDIAADHNHLTMSVLERVAEKHSFKIVFHEKPFAGLNGNGKHCNWSLAVTEYEGRFEGSRNLLEPGQSPEENVRFLAFLTAVVFGVDRHAGLLRAGIASAGNDHRLGANEAPPAIISIFLGDTLTKVVNALVSEDRFVSESRGAISLGVAKLADAKKDNTDRNRTSPFAFTGNKFEFRAVGGSAAVSFPVTLLNAAVADGLHEVTKRIAKATGGKVADNAVVLSVLRDMLKDSRRVCFDGNGYSEEWAREAAERGLLNLRTTPEALAQLDAPSARETLSAYGIYSSQELGSRHHVRREAYIKRVRIEADTLSQMVATLIVPAALGYLGELAASASQLQTIGIEAPQLELAKTLAGELDRTAKARQLFEQKLQLADRTEDEAKLAKLMSAELLPAMAELRASCDRLEHLVEDSRWPLPKYREMLFVY